MLAPRTYKSDLERIAGRMINHNVKSLVRLEGLQQITRIHWEAKFPEEPWSDEESFEKNGHISFKSQFEYDIASAVQRQKVFFYQVSLPHYGDRTFLEESIKRYEMYLKLKSIYPKEFLVPCYDMDIVWHTHQAKPVNYENETKAIIGFHLPHDDSVNNRSPGSKLNDSQAITEKLWKSTFGVDFSRDRCMFRGNPPQGQLLPLTDKTQNSILGRTGMIYKIKCKIVQWIIDNQAEDKLEQMTSGTDGSVVWYKTRLGVKPLEFGGWKEVVETFVKNSDTFDNPLEFEVAEGTEVSLGFTIEEESDYVCCFCLMYDCIVDGKKSELIADFDLHQISIDSLIMGDKFEITLKNSRNLSPSSHFGAEFKLSGLVTKSENQPIWKKLVISPGSYYDCIMPENVESIWGPIPLKHLPEGTENKCKAVTHR